MVGSIEPIDISESLPNEERFMIEMLRRAFGARFTDVDDNSRPGMADGLFVLPDGTHGALEVTSCGSEEGFAQEAKMAELEGLTIDSPWGWLVTVNDSTAKQLSQFVEWLPTIDTYCRATGLVDLTHDSGWIDPVLEACGINSMTAIVDADDPGAIDFTWDDGGICGPINGMTEWLETEMCRPLMLDKIAKLARTGRPHQHLALRIHESGSMPFHLRDHLMSREALPTEDPDLPASLSAVWIVGRWKNPVLWWSRTSGWQRFDLYGTELEM